MGKDTLSTDDLMGLTQDLDDGFYHRRKDAVTLHFALDANVIWLLQDNYELYSSGSAGNTGKTLGRHNAIALIQWSLNHLFNQLSELPMLTAHKQEVDIAFTERYVWDSEDLVEALKVSIEGTKKRNPQLNDREIARNVVENLKENHNKPFIVLSDVLRSKAGHDIVSKLKIRALQTETSKNTPPSLKNTLDKIGIMLHYGDNRPLFSVTQDIKALRDLALSNAKKRKEKIVLITLDKKLLDAVRMSRLLDNQWSSELLIESFDTFWVWLVGKHKDNSRLASTSRLQDVLDDYRVRAKKMFLRDDNRVEGNRIWISNPKWLRNFSRNENLKQFEGLQREVGDALHRQQSITYSHKDIAGLQETCARFFGEIQNMLPTLQLVSLREAEGDPLQALEDALLQYGLSVDAFFQGLNDDIQEHANQSLRMLGAATMLAPPILHAVENYRSMSSHGVAWNRFTHRLPIPIQSDEFDLKAVVELVKDKNDQRLNKFDKLLKMATWRGPIADLVISYLLVHAGDWEEAHRICETSRRRHFPHDSNNPVIYEMALLDAAILRIYRTDIYKLKNAEKLLDFALTLNCKRPQADPHDLRVSLEIIAIKINMILLAEFRRRPNSNESERSNQWTQENQLIFNKLIEFKTNIKQIPASYPTLREKLLANTNVNLLLLLQFASHMEHPPNHQVSNTIAQVLREGINRLSQRHTTRISFFEEIVTSYGIISNTDLINIDPMLELDLHSSLRSKLGRVLQHRDEMNAFEYWIFRDVKSRMQQLEPHT